jgi:Zn-dependent protease with chaperone function
MNPVYEAGGAAAGLVLYAVTLAGQLVAGFARAFAANIVIGISAWIMGWSLPVEQIAVAVGFAPVVVSLLALLVPPLVAPVDGRWWAISTGGRPPEPDEQEAFDRAVEELREIDPALRVPRHWFVAETSRLNASAYSSSLRIDRGTLESPFAAAVIAHELGHLNTSDGRLTSALNLMLLVPVRTPELDPLWSLPFRGLAWLASGEAVRWLTANAWETYWRSREFAADAYAARLGQGPALATSLERSALPHEEPVRMMRFSRNTHPYTKPRIAKLRAHPERPAAAPRP